MYHCYNFASIFLDLFKIENNVTRHLHFHKVMMGNGQFSVHICYFKKLGWPIIYGSEETTLIQIKEVKKNSKFSDIQ